jgi:uncharacterized membrane protein
MRSALPRAVEQLRTSFWFVPAVMVAGAVALSIAALWVDHNFADGIPSDAWWLFGGDDDGARAVLQAIASSMITVASVVFSITILTLSLAAGQFGSRLLRTFMRDAGNQVVLGTFIATFVYSLLALRSVREDFIPHLSVTVGVLLVFLSVAVLTYFIHHVARKIQSESVVTSVAGELTDAIDELFADADDRPEEPATAPTLPADFDAHARVVDADQTGYLQVIAYERLMSVASSRDLVVRLLYRPGDFVIRDCPLLHAWPGARVDDEVEKALVEAFALGSQRLLAQDVEYGIRQLVEIAVRALSPSINDPFTAITCIDRLAAALCQMVHKRFPPACRCDEGGNLRIVTNSSDFLGLADAAFNQVRQHAGNNPAVLIRLMEVIGVVAGVARTDEQRHALRLHAELVRNVGADNFTQARDRQNLDERYVRIVDGERV